MVEVAGYDLRTVGRITQPLAERIAEESDPLMKKYVEPVLGKDMARRVGKKGQFATTLVAQSEHPELMFIPVGGAGIKGTSLLWKHGGKRLVTGGVRAFKAQRAAAAGFKTAAPLSRIKAAGVGFKRGVKTKDARAGTGLEVAATKFQDAFKRFSPATRLTHSRRANLQTGGATYTKRKGIASLPTVSSGLIKTETVAVGNALLDNTDLSGPAKFAVQTATGKDYFDYAEAQRKVDRYDRPSARPPAQTARPASTPGITRQNRIQPASTVERGIAQSRTSRYAQRVDEDSYYGKKKKKVKIAGIRFIK